MSNKLYYYFGYGTYLDELESRNYLPGAKKITSGTVKNRKFELRAFEGRSDRGYCHITDKIEALNSVVHGIVFEHDEEFFCEYPGFECCFVTVYGDDGKMYECWTLRMDKPGFSVCPPDYYWKHIDDGLKLSGFPKDYQETIRETYKAARPCVDADRPEPAPTKPKK